MKHPPTTEHNYMKIILEAANKGTMVLSKVAMIDITHDSWCDSFSGGFCNCNPDVVQSVRSVGTESDSSK